MASSRLEKIGNIFTRVRGLLSSGAMKYEDRPIFYEIYKAFPPLKEPQYHDKVDESITIRPIFYAEDQERASRDESNSLYNLNESRSRKTEVVTQSRQFDASPPKKQEKIFDMKDLEDLKQ